MSKFSRVAPMRNHRTTDIKVQCDRCNLWRPSDAVENGICINCEIEAEQQEVQAVVETPDVSEQTQYHIEVIDDTYEVWNHETGRRIDSFYTQEEAEQAIESLQRQ